MKYYLFKLLPPRPDFAVTMSPAESRAMHDHIVYWSALVQRRTAIAVGPVADPKGTYGVGIVQLEDRADPSAIASSDPAIVADVGLRYEIHPMPMLITGTT